MTLFVDKSRDLPGLAARLARAERVYLDTEFESSRAGTQLSLLQISTAEEIFLIDALRLTDLGPLAGPLGRADVEWVVHAGLQDVALLVERLDLKQRARVFDTQVAWGLTSAEPSVSLAYLKFKLLGIRSGKAHQADDWRQRPLPASQLAYAAEDVEHLPALFAALVARLEAKERVEIAYEASREALWPEPDAPGGLRLEDFRNAWQLDPSSQAALRYLIEWYEALSPDARAEAPEPKALLSIAGRLPENERELARIKGVPRRFAERSGRALTGELMRRTAQATAADFVPIDPPPYATFEDVRLDAWLGTVRAELAAELQIAPELLLPGRVLRRLRASLVQLRDLSAALATLEGFRAKLLPEPVQRLSRTLPPPLARG
ncbi:MAG: hypothetical protein KF718_14775 [Polyangiaceae bacterium]|nr:hypothetical protein [Polyangiaceae bacterium]